VPYSLKIWIAILKGKDFLKVITINGRIILKCIEEVVLEYVGCISLALNGDQLWTVLKTLIKQSILYKFG